MRFSLGSTEYAWAPGPHWVLLRVDLVLALKELKVLQQVSEAAAKEAQVFCHHSFLGCPNEGDAPAALGLDTASCWALCMEASTQSFLKLRKIIFEVLKPHLVHDVTVGREKIDGETLGRCYELI